LEIPDEKPFQHVLGPSQVSKLQDVTSNSRLGAKLLDSKQESWTAFKEISNMSARLTTNSQTGGSE